jgi:hypothetical protein
MQPKQRNYLPKPHFLEATVHDNSGVVFTHCGLPEQCDDKQAFMPYQNHMLLTNNEVIIFLPKSLLWNEVTYQVSPFHIHPFACYWKLKATDTDWGTSRKNSNQTESESVRRTLRCMKWMSAVGTHWLSTRHILNSQLSHHSGMMYTYLPVKKKKD